MFCNLDALRLFETLLYFMLMYCDKCIYIKWFKKIIVCAGILSIYSSNVPGALQIMQLFNAKVLLATQKFINSYFQI